MFDSLSGLQKTIFFHAFRNWKKKKKKPEKQNKKPTQNAVGQKYFIIFLILKIQSQLLGVPKCFLLSLLTFWICWMFQFCPTTLWGHRSYFWLPVSLHWSHVVLKSCEKCCKMWFTTQNISSNVLQATEIIVCGITVILNIFLRAEIMMTSLASSCECKWKAVMYR